MSHLHFTATKEYRRRVIQLGEHPDTVFHVGSLGVENMRKMKLLDHKTLERKIDFSLGTRSALVTFHPVTREAGMAAEQFQHILEALDSCQPLQIIFTKANSDAGGREINKLIDEYVERNQDRSIAFTSMGQLKYFSTLQYVDLVIGNSSSGIIEAPSFECAVVNIGNRQQGRTRAACVIDCPARRDDIIQACTLALSPEFRNRIRGIVNPYEQSGTTDTIMKVLQHTDRIEVAKKFYDLDSMPCILPKLP